MNPNAKELRALRLFVSDDGTRLQMSVLWRYESDGGATYMAADGHTLIVRRAGTHRTMALSDIAKLAPDNADSDKATPGTPPPWDRVFTVPGPGKLAEVYGIDPDYVGRVGDVERAAGLRAAEDFTPSPGMSVKEAKKKRNSRRTGACATWRIPPDALAPWYWRLDAEAALWEGMIMPRRV